MANPPYRLALSLDVEEWYHSGRWLDDTQSRVVPDHKALFQRLYGSDRPAGDILAPTEALLDLFDRYNVKATFFILGEIAHYYPDMTREIARRGHEIACHGMHHVDISVLGPEAFREQIGKAADLLEELTGQRPVGYRAPNLVYEPWATKILEELGFKYDGTVCASRPLGGKYKGWADAPSHPYHPSYEAIGRRGDAELVEIPVPAFPGIKINGGSGIMTRIVGYQWTYQTLRHEIQSGDTVFYFHPWEAGPKPPRGGSALKNAIYFRHMGDWMLRAVEKILQAFEGRVITMGEAAARVNRAEHAE